MTGEHEKKVRGRGLRFVVPAGGVMYFVLPA